MGRHADSRCSTRNVVKGAVAGAAGGLLASWAMNQFQAAMKKAAEEVRPKQPEPSQEQQQQSQSQSQQSSEPATVMTAQAVSHRVLHRELTAEEKRMAGPAVHYGFGAAMGALYGAVAEVWPDATDGGGLAYGTALFVAADEVAVPVLKLSAAPTQTPLSGHASAWAAHLVYGLVTELTRRLVRFILR